METRYNDGSSTMESFDSNAAMLNAMKARLADERVVSVTAHKAGSRPIFGDREYELNALGQWCRVGKKTSTKETT